MIGQFVEITEPDRHLTKEYWQRILGEDFRRDRGRSGANALLNYGYTIIRTAVARAIAATGLHPAIGIHHHGPHNVMRLADDLVEPFRPLTDLRVVGLLDAGQT